MIHIHLFRMLSIVATVLLLPAVNAFVVRASVPGLHASPISSSRLDMVLGPKQFLAIEKRKNPKKFETTIQNLMKKKKLSRKQAETRYGNFLVDPDGFALQAAADERREKGYKDWKEQAIAKSDDPEATRERIDEFQKINSLKGTAIIFLFSAAALYYSSTNTYIPPRLQ